MDKFFLGIYEDIQKKIQKEILTSGIKTSETQLMKEYNCSRAQIRTIISWCVFNGILEVKPKSGIYVKEETAQSFRDKVEVRTYLEKLACRLLIKKITTKQMDTLRSYVQRMSAELQCTPCNLKKFSTNHYNFHLSIIRFSGNQYLINAFLNLNLKYSYLFAEGSHTDIRVLLYSNEEHKQLLDAIKEKNIQKVEKIVDEHLWQHKKIPPSISAVFREG